MHVEMHLWNHNLSLRLDLSNSEPVNPTTPIVPNQVGWRRTSGADASVRPVFFVPFVAQTFDTNNHVAHSFSDNKHSFLFWIAARAPIVYHHHVEERRWRNMSHSQHVGRSRVVGRRRVHDLALYGPPQFQGYQGFLGKFRRLW